MVFIIMDWRLSMLIIFSEVFCFMDGPLVFYLKKRMTILLLLAIDTVGYV